MSSVNLLVSLFYFFHLQMTKYTVIFFSYIKVCKP
nr:MAG TPA: hypothetical protein [Caudoviricetes sp.]